MLSLGDVGQEKGQVVADTRMAGTGTGSLLENARIAHELAGACRQATGRMSSIKVAR